MIPSSLHKSKVCSRPNQISKQWHLSRGWPVIPVWPSKSPSWNRGSQRTSVFWASQLLGKGLKSLSAHKQKQYNTRQKKVEVLSRKKCSMDHLEGCGMVKTSHPGPFPHLSFFTDTYWGLWGQSCWMCICVVTGIMPVCLACALRLSYTTSPKTHLFESFQHPGKGGCIIITIRFQSKKTEAQRG
jgi:hypothetical protein